MCTVFSVPDSLIMILAIINSYLETLEKATEWFTGCTEVGSLAEWLRHCAYDQHGLGSKLTCTIL